MVINTKQYMSASSSHLLIIVVWMQSLSHPHNIQAPTYIHWEQGESQQFDYEAWDS